MAHTHTHNAQQSQKTTLTNTWPTLRLCPCLHLLWYYDIKVGSNSLKIRRYIIVESTFQAIPADQKFYSISTKNVDIFLKILGLSIVNCQFMGKAIYLDVELNSNLNRPFGLLLNLIHPTLKRGNICQGWKINGFTEFRPSTEIFGQNFSAIKWTKF